ncbi:MarR family winged helix-turn-helix transcriptional regulator [Frondihabitans cladoniiphilus]|uniref:MarR family transcriptional regulator n=1 Tax=Frondihabitans cladoniiphilus TaxID=715785 RepID=A0ABP8VHM8_9MICO
MTSELTDVEKHLWHLWKQASETVRSRIAGDLLAETGLSDGDFGVLSRLVDLGGGCLRQNELASSMHWHRSRLSKHLTRMEERGLVVRGPSGDGVEVSILPAGTEAIERSRAVHAEAVRRHLIRLVPDGLAPELAAILDAVLHPE